MTRSQARQTEENVSKTTKCPFGVNIPKLHAEQWQLSVNSDNPGSQLTIAELLCMFIFFL